jgi:hypothetical protein
VQHVSEYTQPSVLILQHLLGTTYIPLEVSLPHTLDLVYAGTETLTLTLSFCEEVSIYNAVRLHTKSKLMQDYRISQYIGEFINTFSNAAYSMYSPSHPAYTGTNPISRSSSSSSRILALRLIYCRP